MITHPETRTPAPTWALSAAAAAAALILALRLAGWAAGALGEVAAVLGGAQ